MVSILSYIVAILITTCLAIVLYPVSAMFWLLGQCGKVSEVLFAFTSKVIRSLWKDVLETRVEKPAEGAEWICSCGQKNTGKFCSNCGKKIEQIEYIEGNTPQDF